MNYIELRLFLKEFSVLQNKMAMTTVISPPGTGRIALAILKKSKYRELTSPVLVKIIKNPLPFPNPCHHLIHNS